MVLRWADRCIVAGVKPVSMSSPSIHRLQNRLGDCRQFGEKFAAIRHKIRKGGLVRTQTDIRTRYERSV
jgi:hypothetical protein